MKVVQIGREEWRALSSNAHLAVFEEARPASADRIDFALLAVKPDNTVMAYVTCRELSDEVLYWQFGGAFPGTKNTINSFKAYSGFVEWTKTHYRAVTTMVENTNTTMLKMAMKVGYRIIGVRTYEGKIYLEHAMEFV